MGSDFAAELLIEAISLMNFVKRLDPVGESGWSWDWQE